MDAEQRHALKTNELAETLMKLREWGERWLNHILIGVTLVALSVAAYKFWSWRSESALAKQWSELGTINPDDPTAGDAPIDQLRKLIAEASDPTLQTLARIRLADALIERAAESDAAARLSDATRELTAAYESSSTPDALKAALLYQLAVAHESLRDFGAAREAYTTIRNDPRFEGSPFRTLVEDRLATLDEIARKVELLPGFAPPPPEPPTNAPVSTILDEPIAPATEPAASDEAAPQPTASAPASNDDPAAEPAGEPPLPSP